MKKETAQFNCQTGDTVIAVRRTRNRVKQERLTIVRTGIRNEHKYPLNFAAVDAQGKTVLLSPFGILGKLEIVILPADVPPELERFKNHPTFTVARVPGRDRYTYCLVCRKNWEIVRRIRLERLSQDISFSDGIWSASDEELVSATEFFIAGPRRVALKHLAIGD